MAENKTEQVAEILESEIKRLKKNKLKKLLIVLLALTSCQTTSDVDNYVKPVVEYEIDLILYLSTDT